MPGINDAVCEICGEELSVDTYYYISAGRLAQGVNSDPKAYTEHILCTSCYAQVNGEMMASIQKRKNAKR